MRKGLGEISKVPEKLHAFGVPVFQDFRIWDANKNGGEMQKCAEPTSSHNTCLLATNSSNVGGATLRSRVGGGNQKPQHEKKNAEKRRTSGKKCAKMRKRSKNALKNAGKCGKMRFLAKIEKMR